MCLTRVENFVVEKNEEVRIGYKYFKKGKDHDVYGALQGGNFKLGKWYHDTKQNPLNANKTLVRTFTHFVDGLPKFANLKQAYPPGYHIFPTLEAAQKSPLNSILYKIKYKNVVCEGKQYDTDCIIARSMLVIGRVK